MGGGKEGREGILHDLDASRAFDEFDFVTVRGIDKNEAAAGGCLRGSVCDLDSLRVKRRDGGVEALYLKGEMDEVFLDSHWPARRKTGQLNQLLAVGHLEKGQVRAARRDLSFQHLQSKNVGVESNRLFHVADAHTSVEEFLDSHRFLLRKEFKGKRQQQYTRNCHFYLPLAGPLVLRSRISALPGIRKFGMGPISR